jgi:hypothetical protein
MVFVIYRKAIILEIVYALDSNMALRMRQEVTSLHSGEEWLIFAQGRKENTGEQGITNLWC